MQTLMDVADVEIPNLAVRVSTTETPFTFRQKFGQTGLAMWLYSLTNPSRSDAAGIYKTVSTDELPISQLRSLEDLLEHLIQIRQAKFVKMPVNLSKWLENL